MIPVSPANAPSDFDERVKNKGLDAIAELVGEAPAKKRRGPKRKKVAARREDIPSDKYPPFWREALPDMLEKYGRLCAYLGLYVERGTGGPTVDHFEPKSKNWRRVYDWSNYRLACLLVNSIKEDLEPELDPWTIKNQWFGLSFEGGDCEVTIGPAAKGDVVAKVDNTIKALDLNHREFREARQEYVDNYKRGPGNGGIDLAYLEIRAPFIASEMRRQNLLVRGDK